MIGLALASRATPVDSVERRPVDTRNQLPTDSYGSGWSTSPTAERRLARAGRSASASAVAVEARERRLRIEALASTLGLGVVAACVLLVAPRDSSENRRSSWPLVSEPFGVGPVSRSQIPLLATPVLGAA